MAEQTDLFFDFADLLKPISAQYFISYRNEPFDLTGFYMKCNTGLNWFKLTYFNWNTTAVFSLNCF